MNLQLEKWDCMRPKASARAMNRGFATTFSGRQPGPEFFAACTNLNFISFVFNVVWLSLRNNIVASTVMVSASSRQNLLPWLQNFRYKLSSLPFSPTTALFSTEKIKHTQVLAPFTWGQHIHTTVSFFFKHNPDFIPSKDDGKLNTKCSALLLLSKKSKTSNTGGTEETGLSFSGALPWDSYK